MTTLEIVEGIRTMCRDLDVVEREVGGTCMASRRFLANLWKVTQASLPPGAYPEITQMIEGGNGGGPEPTTRECVYMLVLPRRFRPGTHVVPYAFATPDAADEWQDKHAATLRALDFETACPTRIPVITMKEIP